MADGVAQVGERVSLLKGSVALRNDNAAIEAPSEQLVVESLNMDASDYRAYSDICWLSEMPLMADIDGLLSEGRPLVAMLYTYRGISRAIPQVQNQDDPNKQAIYENQLRVLSPEIEKLKTLMQYQQRAVSSLARHAAACCSGALPPTPALLGKFVEILDMLSLLDTLKNMKACLNNDFSFFKRAFGFLKRSLAPEEEAFNQMLHLFLANQSSISNQLKTELHKIVNVEELLLLLIYHCEEHVVATKYVLPNERFSLLRVIPYLMFLLDGEHCNVFTHKAVNLSRLKQLFKDNPVVPLYGDMQTTLDHVLAQAPNFRQSNWEQFEPARADPKVANKYLIIRNMDRYRSEYRSFLASWQIGLNARKLHPADKSISYNAAMTGLFLLSSWTGDVLSQTAWKYASPNNSVQGQDIADYERVVRLNYDRAELTALVELIGFIKSLAAVLLDSEADSDALLKRAVHDEMQTFVQLQLRQIIAAVTKKGKNPQARQLLLNVRAVAADWAQGVEPQDPLVTGQEKKKGISLRPKKADEGEVPDISHRNVGPQIGQLTMLRSTIFGMLVESNNYKGIVEKKRWAKIAKELSCVEAVKGDLEKAMVEFYERSFYYPHAMSYAAAVRAASDLGDLWYKEFYLELDKQRQQFPISMSLPWILSNHVLESGAELSDSLFYPLSLYNDAALRAVDTLNRRFLYDEVEGEVNLAFDQLVYKVSSHVWDQHKQQASCAALNAKYLEALKQVDPEAVYVPSKSRWKVVAQQRHLQLLGRHVNVAELISQRLSNMLRKNIEYAISRFEAQDMTGVVELAALLEVLRSTHASLTAEGFVLQPFDQLLAEADESTSLVSFHGRIAFHVIYELVYDFFVSFNFNGVTQRFTPATENVLPESERIVRPKMPARKPQFGLGNSETSMAFSRVFGLYRKFFGQPHIEAVVSLLRFSMPLIFTEVLDGLDRKLGQVIAPYTSALAEGMPPNWRPPLASYGTEGCYGFYELNLQELIAYPDLSLALQHFKELGNGLVFLNMLEHTIARTSASRFVQAAPLLGVRPSATAGSAQASPAHKAIGRVIAALQNFPDAAMSPADLPDLLPAVIRADMAARPGGPSASRSTFKYALEKFKEQLRNNIHMFGEPAHLDTVIPVEHTTEFYRVWSAIQFITCYPQQDGKSNLLELFGDGIIWAGAAIIYLLGQLNRFKVLDFCAHTVRVEEATDMKYNPATPTGARIEQFFANVGQVWSINEEVWRTCAGAVEPLQYPEQTFRPPQEELRQKFIGEGAPEGAVNIQKSRASTRMPQGANLTASIGGGGGGGGSAPPPPPPPSAGPAPPAPPPMAAAPPPPPPAFFPPVALGDAPPPPPPDSVPEVAAPAPPLARAPTGPGPAKIPLKGAAKGSPAPKAVSSAPGKGMVKLKSGVAGAGVLPPPPSNLPPVGSLPPPPMGAALPPPPPTGFLPPPPPAGLPPGFDEMPPPPPPPDHESFQDEDLPPPPPPPESDDWN